MGNPITWRNVDAPNPALAAAPMLAAGNSINTGFDIFSKMIQQRQAMDANNLAAQEEGAKQGYLDRLQGLTTPEAVAAFEASGEGERARQALTSVARSQIRSAGEARQNSLIGVQRSTEKFGWERTAEGRAADTANQAAALAPLTRAALTATTAVSNQQVDTGVQGIARSKQEIAESQQRVTASQSSEARLAAEQADRELERRSTAYKDTVSKLGANTQGVVGTTEGMRSLVEALSKTIKDPNGLTDAITFVTTALQSNPNFARLPTDVVEGLVLSKADQYGRTFGSWDSTLVNHLKTGMTEALKTSGDRMVAHETQRAALTELTQRQKILLGVAEAAAYPGTQEKVDKAMAERAAAAAPPPATVTTPSASQVSPDVLKKALFSRQIALEQEEITAGVRNKASPEVAEYLGSQAKRDRAALRDAGGLSASLGAGIADAATLIPRAVLGTHNAVLRLSNAALGTDLAPVLPEFASKFAPFYERQQRRNGAAYSREDLTALRKQFEADMAAAKNAK